MERQPLFQRVIGLDIHQAQVTACAILTEPDGSVTIERRQFGAFQRDRRELARWCASHRPDTVVMESTGIYWKSPDAALEKAGIQAQVVNARHVKQVPGRKTDVGDAEWLATLARAGLLRGSFVPPAQLRGVAPNPMATPSTANPRTATLWAGPARFAGPYAVVR